MSPSDRPDSRNVTLEDLLRLKRAEQPAPEFWTRFEQELRAKQLAAIIEKRPWWSTFSLAQLMRQAGRFRIPAGAAAALALSVITVREYRSTAPALVESEPTPITELAAVVPTSSLVQSQVEEPGVVAAASLETVEPAAASEKAALLASVDERSGDVRETPGVAVAESEAPAVAVVTTQTAPEPRPAPLPPGGLMAMIPWAGAQAPVAEESSAPMVIGELPDVHFASVVFPGRDHDFGGRVEVDPVVLSAPATSPMAIAQAPSRDALSPSELRRQRILAGIAVADNVSETERSRLSQVRELIAGALDEERLYDNVRRLGMGGDRLTLKF